MSEPKPYNAYTNNPLIHRDRRLGRSSSEWVRSFAAEDMSVLIVCRGPIRKEALDVFREMGITNVGILLSERDSIVYPRALAPELRSIDPNKVHRVPDYTGATKEERVFRVQQMVEICRENGYKYIFAGYGFMAEDADFVSAIEQAGLTFMGPCSYTQNAAGKKDEAKRTALENDVSVTPGLNNATSLLLVKKHKDRAGLEKLVKSEGLDVPALSNSKLSLEELADAILHASYAKGIDLYSIEELGATLREEAQKRLNDFQGSRFRLKAIGGGGGKGQRIFSEAAGVPGLVREILQEVKATGVGENKNILLELNIEQTRHNEIQVLGNGEWCITLGGRDCSLQMHEQKLLEVSVTQEALETAAKKATTEGRAQEAASLETDLTTLRRMEAEAERFGRAVKLDSASTFECIVEGARHFFMEVNTRIQVEHRVSELCYGLRFSNPANASESFEVHSLVEAMALIAKHRGKLPKPTRFLREGAAVEARLNATDRSLSPHAGGVIVHWSDSIEGEIRDDQGISLKNPDTGLFMRYRLAGAYDSNIALLLSTGPDRQASYEHCYDVLRRTVLRGSDLATNLEFHLGLVAWYLSNGVWAKPTTKFVVPYLNLVGLLKQEAVSVDLDYAFQRVVKGALAKAGSAADATKKVLELKETLLLRPIRKLIEEPHFLSAWLSNHRKDFTIEGDRVVWKRNPVEIVAATYHLLAMEYAAGAPSAHVIWKQDNDLLQSALSFYEKLAARPHVPRDFQLLEGLLSSSKASFGFDDATWAKVRAAHAGHQLGLGIFAVLPLIAKKVGFYDLKVLADMTVEIPKPLLDGELAGAMKKVLVPPPFMKSDEIVAVSGGMFYAQEAPTMPSFVEKGSHFKKGDPLYLVEVMKMFNKVLAPFAGTIDEVLVSESGAIVQKGQPLFKVTPDEKVIVEEPAVKAARIRQHTDGYLSNLL
ncbi:MAG TPA: biotin/lipoyl-containing protein [Polyangiales bacterium]|nr:biotin/lipoyl-containing protein [Polyangiales bacterium]